MDLFIKHSLSVAGQSSPGRSIIGAVSMCIEFVIASLLFYSVPGTHGVMFLFMLHTVELVMVFSGAQR